MSQYRFFTARTALIAASTAGFVALGSGFAGAGTLESATQEAAPVVERTLEENVAPTINSLVPQGTGSAAGGALDELQQTANDPDKPAPDLGEALPESEDRIVTPVGDAPNPIPVATDTLAEGQEMTGLDGDPYDTAGHRAGAAVEETAHGAGDRFEESARGVGQGLEDTVTTVVPQAAHTFVDVRDQVVPQASDLERVPALPGEAADRLGAAPLPQSDGLGDREEPLTVPQSSELGLPQIAEGVDTGTAEDLVDGLSRGTDLVHDIDLSDPVSISGGTEAPETPEGMVEHPTVTDLPGSDALPVVS